MSKTEKSKNTDVSLKPDLLRLLTRDEIGLMQEEYEDVSVGFSTWIRVLMQNWRQGTVACKGRADVNKTNKKPFKQKGTGRARAGSARSPLWRGGGVIHGPQARTRTLTIPQKVKQSVLRNMFFDRITSGNFFVADWHVNEKPSTKAAHEFLKQAHLVDQKLVLFVSWQDTLLRSSFANIDAVRIVPFDQINGYDIASGAKLVVLKKDIAQFKEVVSRWN